MYSQIALRQLSLAARVSARSYTSSAKEGSVAASREFGKKEKAHEDQYIKKEERRKLEKLRAQMEKKIAELEDLKKEHDKITSS